MKLERFDVIRFMLVASILLPGIPLPGLFLVRLEEILIFALLPVIWIHSGKRLTWIDFSFVLVGISMFISMMWGAGILGMPMSPRDLMEFVKIIKAWALFRLALAPWLDKNLVGMAKTLLVCISISAVVGIVEWRDWMGLRNVLQAIYVANAGDVGAWRMLGTVGNTNYYGYLMALGLALAVNLWNYNQQRAWRRLTVIAFGLCGLALFLTYSRSAILAALLAICLSLLVRIPRLRYKSAWRVLIRMRWQMLVITILVISAVLWTWNQFQIMNAWTTQAEASLYWRRSPIHRALYRLSFSEVDRGFDVRIEKFWKPNVDLIAESPIFGWGAAKAEQMTYTDNGFITTFRRYGFIGLLCFLLLYGQVSRMLFKGRRTSPGDSIRGRFATIVLTIIAGYMVANFFAEVFYQLQLMSLLWLLVGIAASSVLYPSNSALPKPSSAKNHSRLASHTTFEG